VVVGIVVVVVGAAASLTRWKLILLALVGVGMVSASLASERGLATMAADLPRGRGEVAGVAATDAVPYGSESRFVIQPIGWKPAGEDIGRPWDGPALVVVTEEDGITAGDHVRVVGLLRPEPGHFRGDPVAAIVRATVVTRLEDSSSLFLDAGNALRNRVKTRLAVLSDSPEAALLSGFLIGDIADLPRADNDALRRAGLSHYVAVSGSNVALVLGAWWLMLGPTGAGNKTRAITGLVVLIVFIVATRWESSVIRAATMAGLVMAGRALAVPIDAWGALGGAVTILLVVSGDLAYDIGFQLSVVATGGVLLGMGVWAGRSPRVVWSLLAATVSAQLAVVPLLLLHFGTVPLLSPVANLLAAPLVTGATAAAGIGVVAGWDLPLLVAERLAGLVLEIADRAAAWPQLDLLRVVGLAGLLLVVWPTPVRRVALAGIVVVVAVGAIPPGPPSTPSVVFLDVGQGDAVLLRDPSGAVVLIDGGRDPTVLRTRLRSHGVASVDLLVATHGDSDHVGGLVGFLDDFDVGRIWVPAFAEHGGLLTELIGDAAVVGVPVDHVATGDGAALGEFRLDVLGPSRRYAGDNDGSVVILATTAERSVLLAGDIGAIAQRGLPPLTPTVLMVPHHGAATTDPRWLADTVGSLAVISVGPNSYGHPALEVVEVLEESDTRVLTTQDEGDITISLR
jgi:competence protein ComEC